MIEILGIMTERLQAARLKKTLVANLIFDRNKFEKYDERQIELYTQDWSRGILLSASLDITSSKNTTEYDESVVIDLEDYRDVSDIIRQRDYIVGIYHSLVTQGVVVDINMRKFSEFIIYEKQITLGVLAIQARRFLSISCQHQPPQNPLLRIVSHGIEEPPSSYVNNFIKSFQEGKTPNSKLTFAVAENLGLGC